MEIEFFRVSTIWLKISKFCAIIKIRENMLMTGENAVKYTRIIGLQIRRLRDRNGMTQKELAEHLHVSKSVVSSWETYRTEPDIASVVRMAKLFHVTTDYLLTGNQKEIP